jgi:hypothetical protein
MFRFAIELAFFLAFVVFIVVSTNKYLIKPFLENRELKRFYRNKAMADAIQSKDYNGIDVFLAVYGESLSKTQRNSLEQIRQERYTDSDGGRKA